MHCNGFPPYSNGNDEFDRMCDIMVVRMQLRKDEFDGMCDVMVVGVQLPLYLPPSCNYGVEERARVAPVLPLFFLVFWCKIERKSKRVVDAHIEFVLISSNFAGVFILR